jgi:hypothetical protein
LIAAHRKIARAPGSLLLHAHSSIGCLSANANSRFLAVQFVSIPADKQTERGSPMSQAGDWTMPR